MAGLKHSRLIHTGGTFSMGYDRAGALVPMYESRHGLLAMKVLDLAWDATQQQMLFKQLVDTRELLLQRGSMDISEALTDELESIAAQIGIITGGEVSLASVMQEYRVNPSALQPYDIDGIDFSLRQHYPLLKKAVLDCIKAGDTPIITLGADTLHQVATLLARDLGRHGTLLKHTVIFVASMVPFGDEPHHAGRLLQAAMELATHEMPGAFALAAADRSADRIEVHDVLSGFSKISSTAPQAFASEQVIATISRDQGFVLHNMAYQPHSCALAASDHEVLAHVAPPLRLGRSLSEALCYMSELTDAHVLLELSGEVDASADDIARLRHLVSERASRGVVTVLLNPLVYDEDGELSPCLPATEWHKRPWIEALEESGGVAQTAITVQEAYSNEVLGMGAVETLDAKDRLRRAYGIEPHEVPPARAVAVPKALPLVELRYVPDEVMMERALAVAGQIAEAVRVIDLPGGVMPARHVNALEKLVVQGRHVQMPEVPPVEQSSGKNKRLYASASAFTRFADGLECRAS